MVTEIRESMVTMTKKPPTTQILVATSVLAAFLATIIVIGEVYGK